MTETASEFPNRRSPAVKALAGLILTLAFLFYTYTRSWTLTYDGISTIAAYTRYRETRDRYFFMDAYNLAHPFQVPLQYKIQRAMERMGLDGGDPLSAYRFSQAALAAFCLALAFLFYVDIGAGIPAALAITAVLGFSYGCWNYAVELEAYIAPFTLALVTAYALWRHSVTGRWLYLNAAALAYAMTVAAHFSFIDTVPGMLAFFIYPAWRGIRRAGQVGRAVWFGLFSGAIWFSFIGILFYGMIGRAELANFVKTEAAPGYESGFFGLFKPSAGAVLHSWISIARTFSLAFAGGGGHWRALKSGEFHATLLIPAGLAAFLGALAWLVISRLRRSESQPAWQRRALQWAALGWLGGMYALMVFYNPNIESPKYYGAMLIPFSLLAALACATADRRGAAILTALLAGFAVFLCGVNYALCFHPKMNPAHNADLMAARAMATRAPADATAFVLTYNNTTVRYLEFFHHLDALAILNRDAALDRFQSNRHRLAIDGRLFNVTPEVEEYLASRKLKPDALRDAVEAALADAGFQLPRDTSPALVEAQPVPDRDR